MWLCSLAQQIENGASGICAERSFFPLYKYRYSYNKLQLLDESLMLKML